MNKQSPILIPLLINGVLKNVDHESWKWNLTEMKLDRREKIVLLGESVAAGYFYRPALTLGILLQKALPDFQVIDLSRVDLPFEMLRNFSTLVKELNPSRIIFFAGNNFVPPKDLNFDLVVKDTLAWGETLLPNAQIDFIIPKFNPLWRDAFNGFEKLSPRLDTHLEGALRKFCQNSGMRVIEAPSEHELVDYCHYSWRGLKLLAEEISGSLLEIKLEKKGEVESLKNIFLHTLRYGQTKLCLKHLENLKGLISPAEFSKFVTALVEGILYKGNPLFLENFLQEVFQREVCELASPSLDFFELYFPEKELFEFLRRHATLTKSSGQLKLNLLSPLRTDVSLRKVDKFIYRDPFLHFHSYGNEVLFRFSKDEIQGEAGQIQLSILNSIPVQIFLNKQELSQGRFTAGQLQDYNELELVSASEFLMDRLTIEIA